MSPIDTVIKGLLLTVPLSADWSAVLVPLKSNALPAVPVTTKLCVVLLPDGEPSGELQLPLQVQLALADGELQLQLGDCGGTVVEGATVVGTTPARAAPVVTRSTVTLATAARAARTAAHSAGSVK